MIRCIDHIGEPIGPAYLPWVNCKIPTAARVTLGVSQYYYDSDGDCFVYCGYGHQHSLKTKPTGISLAELLEMARHWHKSNIGKAVPLYIFLQNTLGGRK